MKYFYMSIALLCCSVVGGSPISEVPTTDPRIRTFFSPRGDMLFGGPSFLFKNLIWSGSSLRPMTFRHAQEFCRAKVARLPTAEEFQKFHSRAKRNGIKNLFYRGLFWTSDETERPNEWPGEHKLMTIMQDDGKGNISYSTPKASLYVRCVIDLAKDTSINEPQKPLLTDNIAPSITSTRKPYFRLILGHPPEENPIFFEESSESEEDLPANPLPSKAMGWRHNSNFLITGF